MKSSHIWLYAPALRYIAHKIAKEIESLPVFMQNARQLEKYLL